MYRNDPPTAGLRPSATSTDYNPESESPPTLECDLDDEMLYLHSYYQPGAQLTINIRSCIDETIERTVDVTIAKALTPFTMSQVLLVDIEPPIPDILPAATNSLVLKVFDPRFLQHRNGTKGSAPHPWTLAAETTAARRREFGMNTHTQLPTWWPDDNDAAGWEEYYHHNLEEMFQNEVAAYDRLLPLQGRSIPICYAHGSIVPQTRYKRLVVPRVLVLSYIPGPNLRAIQAGRISPNVGRSLVDTTRAFNALGVIHDDLRAENVLLSPSDRPSRAFVIDFGNAIVRDAESDEEWDWTLEENDEPQLMEMLLNKLGVDHTDLEAMD
uniref:Non-specific serine/threonine protein kinase n=1 Tax=Mycena chlorophos TaxID=658473 RepID=A0ABQ0L6J4_MYCCL|nr:predicted protein [Mycena chlorophos]